MDCVDVLYPYLQLALEAGHSPLHGRERENGCTYRL